MPPTADSSPHRAAPTTDGDAGRAPYALTLAVYVVLAQAAGAAVLVVGRDDYGPGGKGLILAMIGFGLACAFGARRLRAGGALGLLLFEVVGILVALGADWSSIIRLTVLASVVATFALVLSSLHAFPSPELP